MALTEIAAPLLSEKNARMEPSFDAHRREISMPTAQDWDDHRIVITRLYKSLPLRLVKAIMEDEYGFVASERKYKLRLKNWDLQKYQKPKRARGLPGCSTQGSSSGQTVAHTPQTLVRRGHPPSIMTTRNSDGTMSSVRGPQQCSSASASAGLGSRPASEESVLIVGSGGAQPAGYIKNPISLSTVLPRPMPLPDALRNLEHILAHIDRYYRSCVRDQRHQNFSDQGLGPFNMASGYTDDGFTELGVLRIHDPGYAAITLAKAKRYREARIMLGDAQDELDTLFRAQHPTLLPFLLEIICENSTTPEFDVSESFRRYVYELCAIVMGERHSLTIILQLLGLVDCKLETCAMILSRIQQLLSAEFGASQWEARRPVKVFCRVLRHLGRYDEVEQILPAALGSYGSLETPTQSELLGLLYELAWLSARGRGEKETASELFTEILRLTGQDAREGRISHFRIKAFRGLGILAREDSCHDSSKHYFSAALDESRRGLGRRDSNTVRITTELEDSLRQLGRFDEADCLREEGDQILFENGQSAKG